MHVHARHAWVLVRQLCSCQSMQEARRCAAGVRKGQDAAPASCCHHALYQSFTHLHMQATEANKFGPGGWAPQPWPLGTAAQRLGAPTWVLGRSGALGLDPEQPQVLVCRRRRPCPLVGAQPHARVQQRRHALPAHCTAGQDSHTEGKECASKSAAARPCIAASACPPGSLHSGAGQPQGQKQSEPAGAQAGCVEPISAHAAPGSAGRAWLARQPDTLLSMPEGLRS